MVDYSSFYLKFVQRGSGLCRYSTLTDIDTDASQDIKGMTPKIMKLLIEEGFATGSRPPPDRDRQGRAQPSRESTGRDAEGVGLIISS